MEHSRRHPVRTKPSLLLLDAKLVPKSAKLSLISLHFSSAAFAFLHGPKSLYSSREEAFLEWRP